VESGPPSGLMAATGVRTVSLSRRQFSPCPWVPGKPAEAGTPNLRLVSFEGCVRPPDASGGRTLCEECKWSSRWWFRKAI